jgi:transcriptional regulator with XRE-family HTH domain
MRATSTTAALQVPPDQATSRVPELVHASEAIRMISSTVLKELNEHQTTGNVLRTLRDRVGLSENDIARATGVHERSVRRWLEGTQPTQPKADRIDDLRTIVRDLGEMLPSESVVTWLRNRNTGLDRQRPLDVLAQADGYRRVAVQVEALLSGDFN